MKKIAGSLFLGLFVYQASAEVFIASSNHLAYLSVPTNQTLFIFSVKFGTFDNSGSGNMVSGLIVQNGVTNTVYFVNANYDASFRAFTAPYALNGPCQIAFMDEANAVPAAAVVSYEFLQNSLIHSLLAPPNSTNVILAPAGKSIRFLGSTFLWSTVGNGYGYVIFQNGTNTVYNVFINNGDEFAGPLTITIVNPDFSHAQLIAYYFTDDFFVVPDAGYIRGPTGSFEVAVEKSVDLAAWYPVVVYGTGSDQKAFYRLRIEK
jgi:hypothetical protein